jgi:hypothetical protein
MTLNLLTLKFSGVASPFEAPFLRDYYKVSLPQIRIAALLAAVFYAAFGHLDAVLMPEQKSTIWLIRFIIACPVFLGTFLISYSRFFERYMQPILAGNIILAGGGIVGMIVIAPTPINYYYYAGLLLVIVWGYTFVRLRFIWALLAGWVQVALYEIVAIWITPTPYEVLLSNNFFFISMNGIGMLACYSIEFYARRDFFMTYQCSKDQSGTGRTCGKEDHRISDC